MGGKKLDHEILKRLAEQPPWVRTITRRPNRPRPSVQRALKRLEREGAVVAEPLEGLKVYRLKKFQSEDGR